MNTTINNRNKEKQELSSYITVGFQIYCHDVPVPHGLCGEL